MKTILRFVVVMLFLVAQTGCLSPPTLERTVVSYDHAVLNALNEQLLLNIARARFHDPVHFTAVSNVAATFNFQVNAGATPPLGGLDGGFSLAPIFGGSIAENPTFSIVPIEGGEFASRLLTLLDENKVILLLRQGAHVGMVLRLMASELRIITKKIDQTFHNAPNQNGEYEEFRRRVYHLASIQEQNQLFVEPLIFEQTWKLAIDSHEAFEALEKGYDLTYHKGEKAYELRKDVVGRIVITNYDPDLLSNQERIELNQEAEQGATHDLLVDIRPGYPGGDYPLHGNFRLRSFHGILNFIAGGIHERPEYDVSPHPETTLTALGPAKTLEVLESDSPAEDPAIEVQYEGKYFSIPKGRRFAWDEEAFRLLYQLYQMTVTETPRVGVPGITIAK